MAHDPARPKKLTKREKRKLMQDACRAAPCIPVAQGKYPTCVVCVHEGRLFNEL